MGVGRQDTGRSCWRELVLWRLGQVSEGSRFLLSLVIELLLIQDQVPGLFDSQPFALVSI
jgi:hypothetical protein